MWGDSHVFNIQELYATRLFVWRLGFICILKSVLNLNYLKLVSFNVYYLIDTTYTKAVELSIPHGEGGVLFIYYLFIRLYL